MTVTDLSHQTLSQHLSGSLLTRWECILSSVLQPSNLDLCVVSCDLVEGVTEGPQFYAQYGVP